MLLIVRLGRVVRQLVADDHVPEMILLSEVFGGNRLILQQRVGVGTIEIDLAARIEPNALR